jgi:hypothetical protein
MVNLLAFALARYPRDKKKYRVFRWLGLCGIRPGTGSPQALKGKSAKKSLRTQTVMPSPSGQDQLRRGNEFARNNLALEARSNSTRKLDTDAD